MIYIPEEDLDIFEASIKSHTTCDDYSPTKIILTNMLLNEFHNLRYGISLSTEIEIELEKGENLTWGNNYSLNYEKGLLNLILIYRKENGL